jgi:hypothetical protein
MSVRMGCGNPNNGDKFFFRYITKLSTTDIYSQQFKFTDKYFTNQMRPVLNAMKYVGILPIIIPKSGKL